MSRPALEHSTVVIVGGTTGLGFSAVRACVEAGAAVVAVGRDPANVAAVGALGDRVRGIVLDARDPRSAEIAIDAAIESFGSFDALYHVAGGSGRRHGDGPIDEVSVGGVEFTLDLNLKSLIWSNRAAVRRFLARRSGGSILNMASTLAWSPSPAHFATHVYAAAKAGVIGLSRSIASKYAASDIRCNVIAPALFVTPMSRRAQDDADVMAYVATKQPLDGGRAGAPADADAAVVFFLSDASRFVTGQVLAVDGGWSVSEGQHASRGGSGEVSGER